MVLSSDTGAILEDFLDGIDLFEKDLNMNAEEEKMVKIILSFLPSDISQQIVVKRRSESYISLFYGENNFLRLKYSKKAKWVSLFLPHDLATANKDNPLFAAQKNKNQFHWRSDLKALDDLYSLRDFIVASCVHTL